MNTKILLTSHENETFQSQTVFLSGHGFVKCTFKNCTLVITNSPLILKNCNFHNCNWRLDYDILWGNPAHTKMLRKILDMIDGGQIKEFSSVVH